MTAKRPLPLTARSGAKAPGLSALLLLLRPARS